VSIRKWDFLALNGVFKAYSKSTLDTCSEPKSANCGQTPAKENIMTKDWTAGEHTHGLIWIISGGRYVKLNASRLVQGKDFGPVKEYHISQLGRYLLNPGPIEVEKILVGCEVHFHKPSAAGPVGFLKRLLPGKKKNPHQESNQRPQVIFSAFADPGPQLDTPALEAHFESVQEHLRPYDDFFHEISKLDVASIADIVGICEDVDGNRSYLTMEWDINDKLDYLAKHIRKSVKVRLEKVYTEPGLFELRGADFVNYDGTQSFRLIRFLLDGATRSAVSTPDDQVEFWVEDYNLVHYLQLFEHTIQTNPQLQESLRDCVKDRALPLKLMFNQQLDIDYSQHELPRVCREIFEGHQPEEGEKEAMLSFINDRKMSISFHFLPLAGGDGKLCTDISIMQDFRVPESIKDNLPHLYSELSKRAAISEAGKFYLLDTIRGYKDV